MIDKKFIAITLAMGLIVSIGCVMSQDKYAQDMAVKQAAEQQSGYEISGKEPLKEPVAVATIQPDRPARDNPEYELAGFGRAGRAFNGYKVVSYPYPAIPGEIFLYYDNQIVGYIDFYTPGEYGDPALLDIDRRQYVYKFTPQYPITTLNYPIGRFEEILNLLRNEKPLFIFPQEGESIRGGIGTSSIQPVGSG